MTPVAERKEKKELILKTSKQMRSQFQIPSNFNHTLDTTWHSELRQWQSVQVAPEWEKG